MLVNNRHNDKTSRMIMGRGSISAGIYTLLPQLEKHRQHVQNKKSCVFNTPKMLCQPGHNSAFN